MDAGKPAGRVSVRIEASVDARAVGAAQQRNVKLRDVAIRVVDTGELPDRG